MRISHFSEGQISSWYI